MVQPLMKRWALWTAVSAVLLLPLWKFGLRAAFLTAGDLVVDSSVFNAGGSGIAEVEGVEAFQSIGGGQALSMSGGGVEISGGVLVAQLPARTDLDKAHSFPSIFKPSAGHDRITFRGLTKNATIRIFSLSGELVMTLSKTEGTTEDYIWKPVVNGAGRPLSSGVYLFQIEGDKGYNARGKFMVIK